jgi:hypothetical protein
MTTKPNHDAGAVAEDARNVLSAIRGDLHEKEIAKRLTKHELDGFEQDIAALEAGLGARSTRLHAQVEAGVHVAEARAGILHLGKAIREDIAIAFPTNPALQHAFGVGAHVSPDSTASVKTFALSLLSSAHAHHAEAAKVGLDTHAVHDLEHMIHALDGVHDAHVAAAMNRHDDATATDSLLHKVMHEAAHLRLVARRAFIDDETKRSHYASKLPRHAVEHRPKPPAASATP